MWEAFYKATCIMGIVTLYNFIYYVICGHDPSMVHEISYIVLLVFFLFTNNNDKGKMA